MNAPQEILAPTLADLDAMARTALTMLPENLKKFADGVVIRIVDFPGDDVCEEMKLESPFDILGLYQGVSLDEKGVEISGSLPDMVFLYRRPILDYWCESGESLQDVVQHVLIHEIGHHFGFSDEDMEAIDAEGAA